jgi:hypothetical protein
VLHVAGLSAPGELTTSELLRRWEDRLPKFADNRQHDVTELLSHLCSSSRTLANHLSHRQRQNFCCHSCKKTNSIDLCVEDALRCFSEENKKEALLSLIRRAPPQDSDRLDGGACPNCLVSERGDASDIRDIARTGDSLVVALERGSQGTGGSVKKHNTEVTYPLSLVGHDGIERHLCSIVCHLGDSGDQGHYITYRRDSQGFTILNDEKSPQGVSGLQVDHTPVLFWYSVSPKVVNDKRGTALADPGLPQNRSPTLETHRCNGLNVLAVPNILELKTGMSVLIASTNNSSQDRLRWKRTTVVSPPDADRSAALMEEDDDERRPFTEILPLDAYGDSWLIVAPGQDPTAPLGKEPPSNSEPPLTLRRDPSQAQQLQSSCIMDAKCMGLLGDKGPVIESNLRQAFSLQAMDWLHFMERGVVQALTQAARVDKDKLIGYLVFLRNVSRPQRDDGGSW